MYSHYSNYPYPSPHYQSLPPHLHHHHSTSAITNTMPPPVIIPSAAHHQAYNNNNNLMSSSSSAPPPPSPSQSSDNNDDNNFQVAGPEPISKIWQGKAWVLVFYQQPIRARMCGFGDKDRRPISPPPCVRLMIMDPVTKQEIDYEKNSPELAHLILQVDLYSLDGQDEKNLVKHTSNSPGIGSSATIGYPHVYSNQGIPPSQAPTPYNIQNVPAYANQTFAEPPQYPPPNLFPHFPGGPPMHDRPNLPFSDPRNPTLHRSNGYSLVPRPIGSVIMEDERGRPITNPIASPQASGMYTRNLIGSLCSSAFKLKDLEGKTGLWFVLQDLSVRTEGWFRLKANFINIGQAITAPFTPSDDRDAESGTTSTHAPVLATTFSRPFKVFSAKKFPGVIESTELSRTFAAQGIKIPIRKEGASKRKAGDDSDEEGQDFEE